MKLSIKINPIFSFMLLASAGLVAQEAGWVAFSKDQGVVHQQEDEVFVHPLTAPYYHEDSFVTSDVRLWYAYHNFPKSGLLDGGYANVYAVQLRLALTETLQFVAYKDGFTDLNTGLGLTNESGWNDIAAGLKWNFLQDWDHQLHAALGVGYELKTGQGKVFQNDDEVRVWGSVNKGFGKLHLGGTLNYLYAPDKDRGLGDGDRVMGHIHADYWVCKWFSPVLEANAYYVTDEGPLKRIFQRSASPLLRVNRSKKSI